MPAIGNVNVSAYRSYVYAKGGCGSRLEYTAPWFQIELIKVQRPQYLATVRVWAADYRLQVLTGIQSD